MSALNLRTEAPFRPVDWRWEKARLMREDPRTASLLRHQDDDWTRKAKRFQELYEACRDDYDRLLLVRKWPALVEAHDLRFKEDEKRLMRFEVEARLLASDPIERIAEKVGTAPAVVIWYEKVFFNVLDKLANTAYISHCVMGESAQAGMTERDYDVLWKMMGYCGKGIVLDAVIGKTYDATVPESAGQVGDFLSDDIERSVKLKMTVAMRALPVNSYTAMQIAEIYQRFQEIKKMADGAGAAGDMISANIQVAIQSLGWTVGDKRVLISAADPSKIVGRLRDEVLAADDCAVELRADELMQLNTGQTLAPTRARPARFPEKKDAAAKQGSAAQ